MQIILCRKVVVVVVKERKWGAKGNAQLGMWEMEAKKFALIRVCSKESGFVIFFGLGDLWGSRDSLRRM